MYIDKTYMIERFGEKLIAELTDRVEPYTHEIVDSVLESAMETASGLADSYISSRYKTPLSPVPGAIQAHVGSIAFYHLQRDRYTDEARRGYDDAISFLKDISRGAAHLVAEGVESDSPVADAQVIAPDRTFNRDSLKAF